MLLVLIVIPVIGNNSIHLLFNGRKANAARGSAITAIALHQLPHQYREIEFDDISLIIGANIYS